MSLVEQINKLARTIGNRFRDTVYPRLPPLGGKTGYVLSKTTDEDNEYSWLDLDSRINTLSDALVTEAKNTIILEYVKADAKVKTDLQLFFNEFYLNKSEASNLYGSKETVDGLNNAYTELTGEISNKVDVSVYNQDKQIINDKFETKADKDSVYTRTQLYTRDEVDSKFSNLSNTYLSISTYNLNSNLVNRRIDSLEISLIDKVNESYFSQNIDELRDSISNISNNYLPLSQAQNNYYDKYEVDHLLVPLKESLSNKVDMSYLTSNYLTADSVNASLNSKVSTATLTDNYYNKTDINNFLVADSIRYAEQTNVDASGICTATMDMTFSATWYLDPTKFSNENFSILAINILPKAIPFTASSTNAGMFHYCTFLLKVTPGLIIQWPNNTVFLNSKEAPVLKEGIYYVTAASMTTTDNARSFTNEIFISVNVNT